MPTENGEEYLLRIKNGDKNAFQPLIALYLKKSFGIALRFMCNEQDAREMLQESCIKAYKNLDRFNFDNQFGPWFFRILVNTCLNELKRRRIRRFLGIEDEGSIRVGNQSIEVFHTEGPEETVLKKEQSAIIKKALDKIPEKQRTALVLFDIEGFSQQEVADILGCPVGSVMSRVYYGRKRLQVLLKDYFSN